MSHRGFTSRTCGWLVGALVLFGALLVPAVASSAEQWPGGKWTPYPAMYGVKTVTNVPVKMSDGVTLKADVSYPADLKTGERAPGKFPVLLMQNPYFCQDYSAAGADNPLAGNGDYFVGRGYIFAFVCIRGAGRSEGEFVYTNHDQPALDGVELVFWAADKLEGSNGIVGLTGCSYLGLDQLFTVSRLPKKHPVKEMSPFCAGAEIYHEGSLRWGMPTQTTHFFAGGGVLFDPRYSPTGAQLYANIMSGGSESFYSENWAKASPGTYAADIAEKGVPGLFWSGYDDIFALSSQTMNAYLQNAYFGRPVYGQIKPGDPVTGRYQVVVGPWGHGAGIDENLQLEWYDTWLKGVDTGMADTTTPMHLWDATAKHWTNTATLPITPDYTPYYLGPNSTITARPPASEAGDPITWAQPETPGSTLTYTSEPFAKGGTLAGPIGARIYASVTGTNLELIATLFDVAPDGTATNLTFGSVVGSTAARNPQKSWYDRDGLPIMPYCLCDKAVYLEPGKVNPFDFWISPRVATIEPGHALRVVLSTQTPEEVCANVLGPHNCEPTAPQAQSMPGTYTITYSPQAPSSINLPLLPLGALKSAGATEFPRDFGSAPPSATRAQRQGFRASLQVGRSRLAAIRRTGVKALVRCNAPCGGTARVTVSRATARRLGLRSRTLGRAKVVLRRPGSRAVRVRLSPRAARALSAAGRVTLLVTADVRPRAGGLPAHLKGRLSARR